VLAEEESQRARGGHFNLVHLETSLKADCYLVGEDPLHEWAMARRVAHEVGETGVWVAPPEYVIVRKLEWHRDSSSLRHLDDIRAMLRISGDTLNRTELETWIGRLQLQREWQSVAPLA
jgi:hypothetical protein